MFRFIFGLITGVVITKYILTEDITLLQFTENSLKWLLTILVNFTTNK